MTSNTINKIATLIQQNKINEALTLLKEGDALFYEIADILGPLFSQNRTLYDILEEYIQDRRNLIKAKRDMEKNLISVIVDVVRKYQD